MPRRPRIRFRRPRQPEAEAPPPGGQRPAEGEGTATAGRVGDQPGAASGTAADPATSGSGPGSARAGVESSSDDPRAHPGSEQQIEGLRAWLAQVDRKLGVRTYFGAALALLAVAAAAVALVLVLSLRQETASQDDLESLRDQLTGVEQSATRAAESEVRSLSQRLTDLETEVDRLAADQTTSKRELSVIQDDIKELRSEVSGGRSSGGTGP
jgi:uncharacterized protein HemX